MAKEPESPAEVCPVDESTRAAWLKSNSSKPTFPGIPPPKTTATLDSNSCDSRTLDNAPSPPSAPSKPGFFSRWTSSPAKPAPPPTQDLGVERVISTIPRASPIDAPGTAPSNSQGETGVSSGGNWVYPSEKMFFEAMKRKGHEGEVADMKTIVPIHNAVNERAWKEIKEWERPWGGEKCGGPKLYSFLGLPQTLSPKAKFNSLLGYTTPFDRHDWVVDRCGTKVEYIIDFYKGSDKNASGKLNFYLDVRPKLNSMEGWKMRAAKFVGFV